MIEAGTWTGRRSRAACALAVAAVTVPPVALAHLVTTGGAPALEPLVLVTATVALAALWLPVGGRARTAAVVVVAQLAGHAVLAVTTGPATGGCLSVMGRGAALGLRFAVFRADSSCPPGTVTVTPGAAATLAAVLAGASVLLFQAVVAVLASALLVAGRRAWDGVRALLETLAQGLAVALTALRPAPVPARLRVRPRWDEPPAAGHQWSRGVDTRRGPPCGG